MHRSPPVLSKSRYLAGRQCSLRLWYGCFERELATPPDEAKQAVFETGHQVGDLATTRHPGGVLIGGEPWERDDALEATRRALASGAPAIFEAAFLHEGVFVRADILARNSDGGFDLYEVKSTLKVDDVHRRDVALQAWVLRGAGIDLRRVGVLVLDGAYVRGPEGLDVQRLFRFHDCMEVARELEAELEREVREQHRMLAADAAPRVAPGPHCHQPYDCEYFAHCTRDAVVPEHPLQLLPGVGPARAAAYAERGIVALEELPEDEPLSAAQERVRQATLTGQPYRSPELGRVLASVRYPVHHLDFETANPAVPRYEGHSPYSVFPFQWSNHVEHADGRVEHLEYLCDADVDPTAAFAASLIAACGTAGSICVYSAFEATLIRRLAATLPDLREALEALLPRLWDLLPVVREHYYDPAFGGSFSIKDVLPVLVPSLSYADLEVADGRRAGVGYLRSLDTTEAAEREALRAQLLRYCGQDTQAMVEIRHALEAKARQEG